MDFSSIDKFELAAAFPIVASFDGKLSSIDKVAKMHGARSLTSVRKVAALLKDTKKLAALKTPSNWAIVKREFHALICTKAARYRKLRNRFNNLANKSSILLVSNLSVAIAGFIGTAAGVIAPYVALLVYAVSVIGVNVWCQSSR